MKHWLAAAALSAALALAAPAAAEDPPDPRDPAGPENPGDDPGELARDGIERLMRALEAFIDMIPQYEMPEINEDGDIIIRRKRDVAPGPPDDGEDEAFQTHT